MSAKEAYDFMGKTLVMSTITNMSQTDDFFIFFISTFNPNYVGRNGYDAINRTTGRYEFIQTSKFESLGDLEEVDMLSFAS